MARMIPGNRPAWTRERTEAVLDVHGITDTVCLLGVRGYFRDSMGAVGRNDIGIYDDALFIVSPTTFASFNANTDPSVTRPRVATLVPGVWRYKVGIHGLSKPKDRRYTALVQADEVTVDRHGVAADDTGFFGINIHRGAAASTSSLGCQTIHPSQWEAFIALVQAELKRYGQSTLPYLLIVGQG